MHTHNRVQPTTCKEHSDQAAQGQHSPPPKGKQRARQRGLCTQAATTTHTRTSTNGQLSFSQSPTNPPPTHVMRCGTKKGPCTCMDSPMHVPSQCTMSSTPWQRQPTQPQPLTHHTMASDTTWPSPMIAHDCSVKSGLSNTMGTAGGG
jgi:hypothetical protein